MQVVTDPLVQAWLVRHADLITARLDTLVQQALIDPELWMETITPLPPPGAAHDAWRAAMRHVLAYRDHYQITAFVDPLGPGGQEGERGDAHAIAVRALEAISVTGTPRADRRCGPDRDRWNALTKRPRGYEVRGASSSQGELPPQGQRVTDLAQPDEPLTALLRR